MSAHPSPATNGAGARNPDRAYWLAVALVFAGGVALRVQTFTDVWVGVHNAWGGAFYGNMARNWVRYGYGATSLSPIVNSGVVDSSQWEIYYHHPLLSMLTTSVSYHIFGIHEWSARLAPLIFSLLTMALVFQFAKGAFGKMAGLGALLFMALLPVDAYYATHVDPNSSMSIFFTALAVEAYRRWLISGAPKHYFTIVAALVLGCMTGWFTYLVVPGIVGHGWLIERVGRRPGMLLRLWMLPVCVVAVFGLFILHRSIAMSGGRTEVYDALGDRLLKRTVSFGEDRAAIMATYFRHFRWLYTLPVVGLTAAWVGLFLHDLWKKRLRAADWCIAILMSYGFLYALAFPGHLPAHNFFVRTYAPGVALACVVVLSRVAEWFSDRRLRYAVIGAAVAGVSALTIWRTSVLYGSESTANGLTLRGIGEAVAQVTTPRDPVLTPGYDRVLQYYVDRPLTFSLDSPAKIDSAVAATKGPCLIIVPERNAPEYPELLAHLQSHYRERRAPGVLMFSSEAKDAAK